MWCSVCLHVYLLYTHYHNSFSATTNHVVLVPLIFNDYPWSLPNLIFHLYNYATPPPPQKKQCDNESQSTLPTSHFCLCKVTRDCKRRRCFRLERMKGRWKKRKIRWWQDREEHKHVVEWLRGKNRRRRGGGEDESDVVVCVKGWDVKAHFSKFNLC